MSEKNKFTNIAVVGLGYVGLPLCIRFCESGLKVVGLDVDQQKVDAIAEDVDCPKRARRNRLAIYFACCVPNTSIRCFVLSGFRFRLLLFQKWISFPSSDDQTRNMHLSNYVNLSIPNGKINSLCVIYFNIFIFVKIAPYKNVTMHD